MDAVCYLIYSHISGEARLHDDAIVASTDLLFREVGKLKGLDSAILEPESYGEADQSK
jgi:hypothetical protein